MPLLDVSLVTTTLANLIRQYILSTPEAPKVAPLVVSPDPPDKLAGDHAVGVYLYHITEDAYRKNVPAPSADVPPVRFTEMGLLLHYMVSARSDLAGDNRALNEQLMMGLATKALRDYATIDDTTAIAGVKVFPADLQGTDNRFHVTLQPVQPSDAIQYWTAGSQPLRLAGYYQVSAVMLEPERPTTRAGRVFAYGVYSFARGSPRLDGSRNPVRFTVPGEASPRTVQLQPAEAPVGGRVVFFGSDLAGESTSLLIKHPKFAAAVEVGPDWGVTATDGEIHATVQAAAGFQRILPGLYSAVAQVAVTRAVAGAGGAGPNVPLRRFVHASNEVPFTVTPRVDAVGPPTPAGVVTITGAVFQDPALSADAVQVFVGRWLVPQKAGAAALAPGEFEVTSPTTIRVRFPIPGLAPGQTVSLRVLVNGAENAPHWVQVP
jgi:hypothetical protein